MVQIDVLRDLTNFHYEKCFDYAKILDFFNVNPNSIKKLSQVPYLPVSIFKTHKLLSVPENEIVKTLTSSGTSGQQVSKIYLDKQTATDQVRVLAKLLEPYLGPSRLPMLVLDSESVVKSRGTYSARAAGVLGFSIFASSVTYALDSEMRPNFQLVSEFLQKYRNQPVLLYGFTFIAWKNFIQQAKIEKHQFPLAKGVFVHGGGWKKMQDASLSPTEFKKNVYEVFHIDKVVDYYGMAEQTGSIFLECPSGYFHSTDFSNVVIRDFGSLDPVGHEIEGFLQTLSTVPKSYPGHSLLTEDIGVTHGIDDCSCGGGGIYFSVKGRIPKAEIRGCSDTYDSIN